jgi:anti-anti-sigma factor
MEIQHSTRHGCLVVAFSGAIDLASVATVQRTLLKDLSEQPDALICDLAGVQHLDPTAAAVFSTVAKHPASRWPTTSFLLCGARPQVAEALRRVRASQLVRMCVTAAAGPSGPGGRGRPGALAGRAAGTGLGGSAPLPTAARPSGAPSPSDLLPPSPRRSRRRRDLGP